MLTIRLLNLIAILFATVLAVAAQESKSGCPKIEVIEPARVTNPGDEMDFASLATGVGLDVKYEWTVTNGKIIKGQGTLAIRVAELQPNSVVTATLRVIGVPVGCPDSAAGRGGVAPELELESWDEWREMSRNDERG